MAGERGWESGGAREGAQLTICDDNAASERAEARSDKGVGHVSVTTRCRQKLVLCPGEQVYSTGWDGTRLVVAAVAGRTTLAGMLTSRVS